MRRNEEYCQYCETWVPTYCPECGKTVTGSRRCRTMARHLRMAPLHTLGALCPSCRGEPPKLTADEHLHQLWIVLGLGD